MVELIGIRRLHLCFKSLEEASLDLLNVFLENRFHECTETFVFLMVAPGVFSKQVHYEIEERLLDLSEVNGG